MDLEEQSPLKIVICKHTELEKYYIVVVVQENIFSNLTYVKRDGEISHWDSDDDYLDSYEECLEAINKKYEIQEEINTPRGYIPYVATYKTKD